MSFPYTCPYCNRDCTIVDEKYSIAEHFFDMGNKDGLLGLRTAVLVCPNPSCKEYRLQASLFKAESSSTGPWIPVKSLALETWSLRPKSQAKPMPDYIPGPILSDYQEACLIRDLSPKASATLSRRCLQGVIRDFWGIRKSRLIDEVNELKEKIDPTTWEAIDAVRSIGNIGAHMEKDIDLVIDVEPNEASLLIGLIEILIKDWYVNRYERQQKLQSIIKVAEQKAVEKNGG